MNLIHGESLSLMKDMPDNSVDSIVTDPPAGIGFMGKDWDKDKGGRDNWIAWMTEVMTECLRVLKPGAHGFVWALPRTSHWTATALENAGFEVRDIVTHIFGSGFPKSHNTLNKLKKDFSCQKVNKLNVKAAIQNLSQSGEPKETDGLDSVQGSVLVKVNEKGLFEIVGDVRMSSTFQWLELKEKIEESRGHFAILNVKQNGSEKTLTLKIILIGQAVNLSEKTDTLELTWDTENTDSNMISSWKNLLAGVSKEVKTSITSMAINQTIESKICSFLRNQNTQSYITCNHSALKPSNEHWILVRKPLEKKLTVAKNVLKHGTGAINIDVSRVETSEKTERPQKNFCHTKTKTGHDGKGRFPANTIVDESAQAELDEQSGVLKPAGNKDSINRFKKTDGGCFSKDYETKLSLPSDSGGASRFFYCPKASKKDKGPTNTHPTVKNSKLMAYLINMITPPNGVVLDPFMGSGSTGVASQREGFGFIGIEMEEEYFNIAKERLAL